LSLKIARGGGPRESAAAGKNNLYAAGRIIALLQIHDLALSARSGFVRGDGQSLCPQARLNAPRPAVYYYSRAMHRLARVAPF